MYRSAEVKDLASTSEAALTQAIQYCTQKVRPDNWEPSTPLRYGTMSRGDSQAVIERLRAGDGQVCEYCNYSLAKQVAASLGALDANIMAVYMYDYDAPAEDYALGEVGRALPIHLIVWAKRKTAALDAVVDTWDRALTRRYAELIGGRQPAHLLDVQVVDSADVTKRIGYGAMLSSLHHPPTEVWRR